MPTTPPQLDPEKPLAERETEAQPEVPSPGAPLSFVPHEPDGSRAAAPARIRTNRFGELEEHELIRLLDSIEDERARGRFRESIYISVFVWMIIAWVILYGPKYLWHAPKLISPVDVMKQRQIVELNAPVLRHAVVPPPKVDTKTLEKLRAAEPKPVPVPETPPPVPLRAPTAAAPVPPAPLPPPASTAPSLPAAPAPAVARTPDAPTPQPTRPNFSTPGTASDAMRDAARDAARNRGGASGRDGSSGISAPNGARGAGGVEVLSDMQGVDFRQYIARMSRDIMRNWGPLLPEETAPPLSKKGETYIILSILPDGTIGDMKLESSSHDLAIDKSAWGSILAEGKFQSLPSQFHGPNLTLRLHYTVNEEDR
jgi:hypothetical protein